VFEGASGLRGRAAPFPAKFNAMCQTMCQKSSQLPRRKKLSLRNSSSRRCLSGEDDGTRTSNNRIESPVQPTSGARRSGS
jgi:hypothetical protein